MRNYYAVGKDGKIIAAFYGHVNEAEQFAKDLANEFQEAIYLIVGEHSGIEALPDGTSWSEETNTNDVLFEGQAKPTPS